MFDFFHCGFSNEDVYMAFNQFTLVTFIWFFVQMWLSRVVGDQLVLGVTKDRGAHPIGQLARIEQSEKKGYGFSMIFKILW